LFLPISAVVEFKNSVFRKIESVAKRKRV